MIPFHAHQFLAYQGNQSEIFPIEQGFSISKPLLIQGKSKTAPHIAKGLVHVFFGMHRKVSDATAGESILRRT